MQPTIQHDQPNQEFTASLDGHSAELAYSRPTPKLLDFTHTFVDEALRNQGVAEAMAQQALAYARAQHLKVRASCEFMQHFLQKNAREYADILAE